MAKDSNFSFICVIRKVSTLFVYHVVCELVCHSHQNKVIEWLNPQTDFLLIPDARNPVKVLARLVSSEAISLAYISSLCTAFPWYSLCTHLGFLRFYLFILKGRITKRKTQRGSNFLSANLFIKWVQYQSLDQAEARSLDLYLGLPCGHRVLTTWAIFYYLPRHISKKLDHKRRWHDMNQCPYKMRAL